MRRLNRKPLPGHPIYQDSSSEGELIINKNEVEKSISFLLRLLKNIMEETKIETFTGQLKVPCFKFENEIIWVTTAMILLEFGDVLG